jgi:hypothetical protein
MNIKNIFITTGISVLFGFYSFYNILEYINGIDRLYMYKISELQIKLEESNNKYKSLETEYMIINKELIKLYDIVKELERKNEILDTFFTSNNNVDTSYEEEFNTSLNNQPICDEHCDLNSMIPKVRKETMSSIDILNSIFETDQKESGILDMSCVEIINDISTNSLKLSPCSNRRNSFSSPEIPQVTLRPRSLSVTELNWAGLTKKFLFG